MGFSTRYPRPPPSPTTRYPRPPPSPTTRSRPTPPPTTTIPTNDPSPPTNPSPPPTTSTHPTTSTTPIQRTIRKVNLKIEMVNLKVERTGKNQLGYFYDHRRHLDLIHFQRLYPSLSRNKGEENSSLKKQEAIGICVNFNFDPDENGNTLASILPFYTAINQYLVILTPTALNKLSPRNLELFDEFNVTSILVDHHRSNEDHSPFLIDHLKRRNTVYHIECADGRSGQSQHKCLLLCAQFYFLLEVEHSSIEGILYLADDLYFNYDYVFSHPERFSLDEFWSVPWMQLLDIITEDKGHLGNTWYWWKNKPQFWKNFRDFFLSTSKTSEQYRRIFQILYGSNKRLAITMADLLYIPFADNQLTNFISISKQFSTLFSSDIFCEIIFSLLVDATMALSGHWPFQNDQPIYNLSVNLLNNISIMEQMERTNLIKNGRDPYSFNQTFRQRPSLFNPDAYIWDHNRRNRELFQTAILNGTVPIVYLTEPWPYKTEFIHPIKLSNNQLWTFHLWHQGMKLQIQQLKLYQKHQMNIYSLDFASKTN